MNQEIKIPTLKWEVINMYFMEGFLVQRTLLIWVIVDRMTTFSRYLVVKTKDSAEDNAKMYINEFRI